MARQVGHKSGFAACLSVRILRGIQGRPYFRIHQQGLIIMEAAGARAPTHKLGQPQKCVKNKTVQI